MGLIDHIREQRDSWTKRFEEQRQESVDEEFEKLSEEEQQRMAADPNYVTERSYSVIVRDFEQEACFVLMFWALSILAYKGVNVRRQQEQLEQDKFTCYNWAKDESGIP